MPYLSTSTAAHPVPSSIISSDQLTKRELLHGVTKSISIPSHVTCETPQSRSEGTQNPASCSSHDGPFTSTVSTSYDENDTGPVTLSQSTKKDNDSKQEHGYNGALPVYDDELKQIVSSSPTTYRNKNTDGTTLPPITKDWSFDVLNPPNDSPTPPSTKSLGHHPDDVGPNDVLMVLGSMATRNMGNSKLMELVDQFKVVYEAGEKTQKSALLRSIILIIRNRGGRFFRLKHRVEEKKYELFEIGDDRAIQMLSEKIRRRCGKRRRRLRRIPNPASTMFAAPTSTRDIMDTTGFGSNYQRPIGHYDQAMYRNGSLDYGNYNAHMPPCVSNPWYMNGGNMRVNQCLSTPNFVAESCAPTWSYASPPPSTQYNLVPRERLVSLYQAEMHRPHLTRPYDERNVDSRSMIAVRANCNNSLAVYPSPPTMTGYPMRADCHGGLHERFHSSISASPCHDQNMYHPNVYLHPSSLMPAIPGGPTLRTIIDDFHGHVDQRHNGSFTGTHVKRPLEMRNVGVGRETFVYPK